MAKAVTGSKPTVDRKALDKFASEFLFKKPEMGEDGIMHTPRYKTGIAMLDKLLGGGLAIGKVFSIGAEEGVGKTTMLLSVCGNIIETYQKRCVFIATEGGATFELIYDMGLGDYLWDPTDNPDGLLVLLGANTVQSIERLVKQYANDDDTALIILDSTYSVVDAKMMDVNVVATESGAVGIRARMWSGVASILEGTIKMSNCSLFLVHQARMNLSGFIPKMESSTNKALKHITSAEIWGKKKMWIGEGNVASKEIKDHEAIGAIVTLSTKKNRFTKPFAAVDIPILFGKGVSNKWAYRQWLEEHNYVNDVTGEVSEETMLRGSGYYKLTLPSGEYMGRGAAWVWETLDEHWDEVVSYADTHGGFEPRKVTDEDIVVGLE